MARKPRSTAAKEQELAILDALRFIKVAQNENGKASYQKHCRFVRSASEQSFVVGFDGILAAGYPVIEEMAACPHTFRLINALERVRGAYSLTLLDNQRLSIMSGAYRAVVPCVAHNEFEYIMPDANLYKLDNAWKQAAVRAGLYCTEGATTVMASSVVTFGASMVGTNGMAIVESYHGHQMPPDLIIPMAFVHAVSKTALDLVGFGYSQQSLTFYFENGAWIRTQLYQEQFPNFQRYLSELDMRGCTDLPAGFFDAVAAVVPFSPVSHVVIDRDQVRSHTDNTEGAQHQCDGLPYEMLRFNGDYLLKLKGFATKADFTTYPNFMVAMGEQTRTIITKISQ